VSVEFLAKSRASLEALKSANLLRSLNINALITGERGVGKLTLAKYILDAPVLNGEEDVENIIDGLYHNDKAIIKNFDKIAHIDILENTIKKRKVRIIATTSKDIYDKICDKFFSLKINLPPLRERKEDVYLLGKKFLKEVEDILFIKSSVDLAKCKADLSENCYSLRRSIYKEAIIDLLGEKEIMEILQRLLESKIGTKNDYRNNLYLYEIPLIKAGKKRFGSQLKMAKEFGINRNTLRKKINEYNIKI